MLKKIPFVFLTLVALCCPLCLLAQDTLPKPAYFQSYADKLHIRLYGITKYNRFFLNKDDISLNERLGYSPNRNLNLGAGFNHKWLGIAFAFDLPFINKDDNVRGNTHSFDFLLNIITKRLIIDVFYQEYFGYYFTSPRLLDKTWKDGDAYPQREDLKTTSYGLNAYYVFNHKKFSYKAAFIQTERQLKSAGSFLANFGANRYRLWGDSSIVPSNIAKFESTDKFKDGTFYTLAATAGYIHTFVVLQRIYATLGATGGFSANYKEYFDDNSDKVHINWSLGTSITGRFALGYNSEKFFIGTNMSFQTYRVNLNEKFNLGYEIGVMRIFFGYRFNTPRQLRLPSFGK